MHQAVLADTAELYRVEASLKLDPKRRSGLGQYLTPAPIGRFMANLFAGFSNNIRLLDPGAGVGSLSAAVLERTGIVGKKPKAVAVTCYEIEPLLVTYLKATLAGRVRPPTGQKKPPVMHGLATRRLLHTPCPCGRQKECSNSHLARKEKRMTLVATTSHTVNTNAQPFQPDEYIPGYASSNLFRRSEYFFALGVLTTGSASFFPGRAKLAKRLGCCERTVSRDVTRPEELGYIRPGGQDCPRWGEFGGLLIPPGPKMRGLIRDTVAALIDRGIPQTP